LEQTKKQTNIISNRIKKMFSNCSGADLNDLKRLPLGANEFQTLIDLRCLTGADDNDKQT
jgi:hypothetical protein